MITHIYNWNNNSICVRAASSRDGLRNDDAQLWGKAGLRTKTARTKELTDLVHMRCLDTRFLTHWSVFVRLLFICVVVFFLCFHFIFQSTWPQTALLFASSLSPTELTDTDTRLCANVKSDIDLLVFIQKCMQLLHYFEVVHRQTNRAHAHTLYFRMDTYGQSLNAHLINCWLKCFFNVQFPYRQTIPSRTPSSTEPRRWTLLLVEGSLFPALGSLLFLNQLHMSVQSCLHVDMVTPDQEP